MFEAFGMDSLGTETLKVRLYEYRATDVSTTIEVKWECSQLTVDCRD